MYCQNTTALGCTRCRAMSEHQRPYPYKITRHSIGEFSKAVACGNVKTKSAIEMLPLGYQLLFWAIVEPEKFDKAMRQSHLGDKSSERKEYK